MALPLPTPMPNPMTFVRLEVTSHRYGNPHAYPHGSPAISKLRAIPYGYRNGSSHACPCGVRAPSKQRAIPIASRCLSSQLSRALEVTRYPHGTAPMAIPMSIPMAFGRTRRYEPSRWLPMCRPSSLSRRAIPMLIPMATSYPHGNRFQTREWQLLSVIQTLYSVDWHQILPHRQPILLPVCSAAYAPHNLLHRFHILLQTVFCCTYTMFFVRRRHRILLRRHYPLSCEHDFLLPRHKIKYCCSSIVFR